MGNPLDNELNRLEREDEFRRQRAEKEQWQASRARQKVVDAIAAFLPRMNAMGNWGIEPYRRRFLRWQYAWRIFGSKSDTSAGFWLTPDGYIPRGDDWVPFRSANFFGIGPEGERLAALPSPDRVNPGDDSSHMFLADIMVAAMAELIRAAERATRS
jgi:hypothetical protein